MADEARGPGWALLLARVRLALLALGVLLLVAAAVAPVVAPAGIAVLVLGAAAYFRLGTVHAPPRVVAPPVTGTWRVLNGPGTTVPSHLHAYGQTYAVDLVHVGAEPPAPGAHPPAAYSGFGRPVLAVADGTVVRVRDDRPDHDSRTSTGMLVLMAAEGMLRELLGPAGVVGNHVVLDIGGGTFAAVAHLRRGSARVAAGDAVRAGDVLGECGNSGNSSEPHVHLQLMDRPGFGTAAGLPFRFAGPAPLPEDGAVVDFATRGAPGG